MHLGNLRTALIAWLFARTSSQPFILRIDDLDGARTRPGCTDQIVEDLRWLGLDWDEGPDIGGPFGPYVESERGDLYREHLDRLLSMGAVYPCYCSRKDIVQAASAPHAPHRDNVYPGTCRNAERRERQHARHSGRQAAYRFRLTQESIEVLDQIRGRRRQQLTGPGDDFVVWRSDGTAAYQLAVVVDDALMHVGEVVRGEDLLDSTPLQIVLYRAFGYRPPTFAHVPLWFGDNGERLAKRAHSAGLQVLRESGADPRDVVGMMAASCGLAEVGTRCTAAELLSRVTPRQLREVRNAQR
jgi:glutamyl-tRNA synthetase